jgi:hypothetical protein
LRVRVERRCTYEIIKFNDSVRARELVLATMTVGNRT